jgi:hypothetical protein
MANSFYTPTQVAQEFVHLLEQELVLGSAVGVDLSDEFKMNGSTVYVRRQMQYLGQDNNIDLTSYAEDVTEGTVAVSMNKTWSNKVSVGALDRSLSFDRWSEQVILPMARRAAEKIETSIAALYSKFYHFTGTPGTGAWDPYFRLTMGAGKWDKATVAKGGTSLGCRYRVASFAYVFAEGYYNYYSVHLSASDSSNGTGGSATIQEGGGRAGFGFTF